MPYTQDIYEHAMTGFRLELEKLERRMGEIRSMLAPKRKKEERAPIGDSPDGMTAKRKLRRRMSAAARARIAAAQRKRWRRWHRERSAA